MNTKLYLLLLLLPTTIFAQVIIKPRGCFAGTNGTNTEVLAHPEVRGVLLTEKWADIETSPGVYDFSNLNTKINTVKAAGLKFSLAIAGGAFGSPDWLMDTLNVDYHDFEYQNQTWRLPFWWDTVCNQRLTNLITQLGNQYATDSMLSHIYVTQMTVNGIEGHLNGVDMSEFASEGFTDQKWITAAKTTTTAFANAFPDKPIVFEVHEIDQETTIPATIITDVTNDPSFCGRIGIGMWWISGKTTYQTNLIDFIYNFQGDKYAQIIGRSDQVERFKDNLYSTVFTQAKDLGIRYIEPWPYEFQYHTHDALMQDFNMWADAHFSESDPCLLSSSNDMMLPEMKIYITPNPTHGNLTIQVDGSYQHLEIKVFNLSGEEVFKSTTKTELDIGHLSNGVYFLQCTINGKSSINKLIKQ